MGLPITNCIVSFANSTVLNNPTAAALFDDLKPTMHIVITGGHRATPLVKNKAYKIVGTVSNLPRTFLNMSCKDTADPADFQKSLTEAEDESTKE